MEGGFIWNALEISEPPFICREYTTVLFYLPMTYIAMNKTLNVKNV